VVVVVVDVIGTPQEVPITVGRGHLSLPDEGGVVAAVF